MAQYDSCSVGKPFDVLVIGGGLAGQTAAINLAKNRNVLLVCKKDLATSASSRAQGGISAVFAEPDSHYKHLQDMLVAGAHLNNIDASRYIIENGRQAIDWLIECGVTFDADAATIDELSTFSTNTAAVAPRPK